MLRKHWQNWIITTLGCWLAVTPWLQNSVPADGGLATPASWSFIAAGSAAAVLAAAAQYTGNSWEEWGCVAIGIWLVLSPWMLGFTDNGLTAWTAVLCGSAITVLAAWCIAGGAWRRKT